MAENTKDADAIAERLQREPDLCGAGHVLLIHTDKTGEITAKDLDKARELARTVDSGKAKATVAGPASQDKGCAPKR